MVIRIRKINNMQKLRTHKKYIRRGFGILISGFLVLLIFTATLLVPTFGSKALAYSQISSRSIEMSDSTVSVTGESYKVQFTTASSIQDIIIDFCPDSPLYADTCSTLTGFTAASAGLTVGTGTTGWTITNKSAGHVELQGTATTGTLNFTLTNITNPSSVGSFYGRIYDYTTTTTGYTSPTSPGSSVADFGGIALSTVATVDVTARVQEELTFCAASIAITNECANAGANPPNLDIGHGTPTLILDSTSVDTATAYIQTSTNAQGGVVVRMKNGNACGGLSDDGGATCNIPPVGASAATIVAGTADFGLYVGTSSGGVGTVNPDAPYNTTNEYAMDNSSLPDNIITTYGSQIASTAGAVNNVNTPLTFAATASNTTAAGIYTAAMTLIATGTY
jgi:hypothetical protein